MPQGEMALDHDDIAIRGMMVIQDGELLWVGKVTTVVMGALIIGVALFLATLMVQIHRLPPAHPLGIALWSHLILPEPCFAVFPCATKMSSMA